MKAIQRSKLIVKRDSRVSPDAELLIAFAAVLTRKGVIVEDFVVTHRKEIVVNMQSAPRHVAFFNFCDGRPKTRPVDKKVPRHGMNYLSGGIRIAVLNSSAANNLLSKLVRTYLPLQRKT